MVHSAGAPHPDLHKGMEHEHCEMFGHDEQFKTTNYGVTTTPAKEYEIATGKRDCPEEDKNDVKGTPVRKIQRIEDLETIEVTRKAKLETVEIVAVVR